MKPKRTWQFNFFSRTFTAGLLIALASVLAPGPVQAQSFLDLAGLSPYAHYKTFETEHFKFIYQEGYFNFTERAAAHLEHAHEILSPILKWQPRYKTDILVADNEDSANGFTMPALRVGIVLIATPPEEWFSTSYSDDWIKLLVFHEYTHFLNIDATRGLLEAARIFFGDIIRPNGLWPTWMLEGLAVYYETRTSKLGRGRSPYYEGILRAYLNENRLNTHDDRGITLDRVNAPYPYFPSGEIPYLFGYHLWDEFSKDHAVNADTDAAMGEYSYRSSGRIPYFIEGNLENVMGKNWKDYWNSFVDSSKARLGKQIEQVKADDESKAELLTHAKYSSILGAVSPDGEWLAYSESSLDDQPRLVLMNLKTKETRRLEEKTLGVGMSFTPDSKGLVYSTLIRTKTYSLFSDLFFYDLRRNKTRPLTVGLRAKDPSVSPDGTKVTFIRSEKATNVLCTATLAKENRRYVLKDIATLYTPPEFSILSTPSFMNDDEIVFSKQEIGQTQSDIMIIPLSDAKLWPLVADGAMNRNPKWIDGKVTYVSDRSGIENVYEIPAIGGDAKALTNVVTSVVFPEIAPDRTMYASLLTSDGYEIAHFSDIHSREPLAKISAVDAPETIPAALTEPTLKFSESDAKDYSPWSSLAPRQWAPVSLITYNSDSGASIIGTLLGFDSTGKHQYFGYAGYNFKPATVDGAFTYTYYGFRPVISLSASSVTTDIATDQYHDQYRNSSAVNLSASYPIRFTYSSLTPSIYGFVEWNRIYDLETRQKLPNPDFEYNNPLVPGLGVSLAFSDAENTRLGYMPEEGNDVLVAAEQRIDAVNDESVIKYLASYTHYFDLGRHMVLMPKFRFLGSTRTTGFDHSYARVQGKNSYDIYDEGKQINLNRIGIRGYSDFTLYRKQAMVGGVDYDFPLGKPFLGLHDTLPFFLKQIHGFVYAETAYLPSFNLHPDMYLPSFGGGVSADTQLLVDVPITFTLEVQNGTRQDYGGSTIVFLSLQGGSLF